MAQISQQQQMWEFNRSSGLIGYILWVGDSDMSQR